MHLSKRNPTRFLAPGCAALVLAFAHGGIRAQNSPPGAAGQKPDIPAPLNGAAPPANAPVPAPPNVPAVSAPDLRIEFLGAEPGYVVGSDHLTLLCVVRNAGGASLPANSLRLRCYAVTGLDYTSGELIPVLPALSPNQSVAYRWRLAPSNNDSPMVAAVLFEPVPAVAPTTGGLDTSEGASRVALASHSEASTLGVDVLPATRAAMAVIPRLPNSPHLWIGVASPDADAGSRSAHIGNDRVALNVLAADGRLPVLLLGGKQGTSWRLLATGTPLIEVRSGEDGQTPWWATFRWRDSEVRSDRDSATLTLTGSIGDQWRATMSFEARRNTCILYGHLRLTARRSMRLFGIQFPRLLAAVNNPEGPAPKTDGSPLLLGVPDSLLPDGAHVAASHLGGLTFGLVWPSLSPFADWRWDRLPAGDSAHLPVLGVQHETAGTGEVVLQGATLEFPFRLFTYGPSDTIRDALRFVF